MTKFHFIDNGTVNFSKNCSSLAVPSLEYQARLICSKNNDNICFFLGGNTNGNKICKFNFANPSQINYTDSSRLVSGIAPVDENNVIASGYHFNEGPPAFIFFSSNHSSTSPNWAIDREAGNH